MVPDIILKYALSFLGLPYDFGGSNPMVGLDCSGLCVEVLTAAGVMPNKSDASAQGLYDLLSKAGVIGKRDAGALSFYGKSLAEISHVTFHLTRYHVIEAGGGDSTVKTVQDAIARNAFIRIRPYKYRKDYLTTVMPTYPPLPSDDA